MLVLCSLKPLSAQPGAQSQNPAGPNTSLQAVPRNGNEVQQLIEAFYISRLQEELKLSDEQYAAVIPAVKNYLRTRQMGARQKHQVEIQLNRLLDSSAPDDQVQAKLKELDEVKRQNEQSLQGAMAAIDSKLDVRQQARFRQYQQHTDQRISHMIQQIHESRRMQRMQGGPPRPNPPGPAPSRKFKQQN